MSELKPCPVPWCKWKNPVAKSSLPASSPIWKFVVTCGCGLVTPYFETRNEAIAAWNSRPSDAVLEAAGKVAEARRLQMSIGGGNVNLGVLALDREPEGDYRRSRGPASRGGNE